ncbi:FAD-dependent oxidoreductase [Spiroplasma sp. AdecLV25b]|uniref:FAD-dependent oxidoreductase n=1 Tax=Spiroplasma sp. AdecLV25b TaxID=3027162 RepID=UPI0027E01737|nr:FAD-dependent oxidoreductase [Spiroplasma sp. AdecLV25b]
MEKNPKIVVIGINHAGTTALKAIMKTNPNAQVVAYDRNDNISFLGCGIALWVGKEFNDSKGLFYADEEKLTKLGAKVNLNHEMISYNGKDKTIKIKNMKTNEIITETYDKLILGIGSWPILNPGGKEIPGLIAHKDGVIVKDNLNGVKLTNGIHLSKLYQHAQEIIAHLNKPEVKKVVVIGAGYIGIELVEAFYKDKKQVTLIDFESRIMPRYYDEEFTTDVETTMKNAGVKLQLGETLLEFITKDDKVSQVKTNKGTYDADLVIMAVGFLPNTTVVKDESGKPQITLDARGAIEVDQYFQTSDPNIYAIGDCINIRSNAWNKNVNIALATNAVRTGLVTGINVTKTNPKERVAFPGVQGTNAISVFGWKLCATGLSELSAGAIFGKDKIEAYFYKDTVFPPFMAENHEVKIKIIWEKSSRRILGAEIGSTHDHTETISMFSLAILKQVTIDEIPLVDMFFLPHFNKPYNFVTAAALLATGLLTKEDIAYPDPYKKK